MSETYLFMSNPQPVAGGGRAKYREPEETMEDIAATSNIMWDSRVVRGMPSGKPVQMAGARHGTSDKLFQKTSKQIRKENKQKKERLVRRGLIRPSFPTAAEIHASITVPKKRVEVPLHLYLQEQEEPTPVTNVTSQTDAFVQEEYELKPPVYIPRKTGVDAGTQVDNAMVFKFDVDVMPVLETVISKTLEQSLMEVLQEEELDFMRRRTVKMLESRAEQKKIMQKREDDERELESAMRKLLQLARLRKQAEATAQAKIASRAYAKGFLKGLRQDVFNSLTQQHFFEEPLQTSVRTFMPWLYAKVEQQIATGQDASQALHSVVLQSVQGLAQKKKEMREQKQKEKEHSEKEAKARAEYNQLIARRKQRLEMFIHCAEIKKSPIGPLRLNASNSFGDVVEFVTAWLQENADDMDNLDPSTMKFFWGEKLLHDHDMLLFELGLDRLGELRLLIEGREPPPVEPDSETEGGDTTAADDDDN